MHVCHVYVYAIPRNGDSMSALQEALHVARVKALPHVQREAATCWQSTASYGFKHTVTNRTRGNRHVMQCVWVHRAVAVRSAYHVRLATERKVTHLISENGFLEDVFRLARLNHAVNVIFRHVLACVRACLGSPEPMRARCVQHAC